MITTANKTKGPTMAFDDMIMEWQAAKEMLAEIKEREQNLRNQIIAATFNTEEEGTQKHQLGQGFALKAVVKKNYRMGNKADVEVALSQLEDSIADGLVKWKPDLSKKAYTMLNDADKKVIDTVITTSFGMPSLELIVPKTKDTIPTLAK